MYVEYLETINFITKLIVDTCNYCNKFFLREQTLLTKSCCTKIDSYTAVRIKFIYGLFPQTLVKVYWNSRAELEEEIKERAIVSVNRNSTSMQLIHGSNRIQMYFFYLLHQLSDLVKGNLFFLYFYYGHVEMIRERTFLTFAQLMIV